MKTSNRRPWTSRLLSAAGIIAVVAVAIVFAPEGLGGRMTYLVVSGNSMEPKYHRGDLVVVRQRDHYAVGEVVVYEHPQIGRIVHRVIGREGTRYVFKGDNNDFTDGYQPAANELVGSAWFSTPAIGSWLRRLREPLPLTVLTLLSVVGLVGGLGRQRGHARRKRGLAASPLQVQGETS